MISASIPAVTGAVQEVLSDLLVVSRENRNPRLPQRVGTINPIWDVVVRVYILGKKKKAHSESVVLNPGEVDKDTKCLI